MIGGAWPFLVRGVICLLNCVSKFKPERQGAAIETVFECEL